MPHIEPTKAPPSFSVNVTLHDAAQQARDRMEYPDKKPRSAVNYRVAEGPQRCGGCDFGRFTPGDASGTCEKVAGPIQKGMLCDLFASETTEAYDEDSEVVL